MKESRNLEFKSDKTKTYLKTVSAYANYDGGQIIFGVNDDGTPLGLENPKQFCLDIENTINDTINPHPDYELSVSEKEKTVTLTVKPGINTPYMYNSKAYRRNDTSTVEVDQLELSRLILNGKRINYEELPAEKKDLSFKALEAIAEKEIGIKEINNDILKTLNLYNQETGFNHAAELLADKNPFPGIDIARFGDSISIILKRKTFDGISILEELENAVSIYKDYYQYEEIQGMERKIVETIPERAFRESIANALMHRTWDLNAQIRVLMFDDRIEISSPGGLPPGMSKEEYIKGNVSVLRNPIIGNVLYRLHIVEILGTGVRRINEEYATSNRKPVFEVLDNSIKVILPTITALDLSEDEDMVYSILSKRTPKATGEITKAVPFGKSKVTTILKKLLEKEYIVVEGNGRGTKYKKC